MRKITLITLAICSLMFTNAYADSSITVTGSMVITVPAPYSCDEAIHGTCAHFGVGDASNMEEFNITNWVSYIDFISGEVYEKCDVTSGTVTCNFDTANCPDPATAADGHDEPGTVTCHGCNGQNNLPLSVNEAKCCLIYGTSQGPNGETHCDHPSN